MSLLLRRVIQNPTVLKAIPAAKAFIPYPLGRDPYSLPKLKPVSIDDMDHRPISLRYRVTAMIELSDLDEASNLSRLVVLDKFRDGKDTVFICNSVIGAMCEAKRYDEAISLFNYFFNKFETCPNMLSFNLIFKAHCDQGNIDEALQLYRHVLLEGRFSPGIDSYRILTKALVDARRFKEACDLAKSMRVCDFIVYNIIIRGFLDMGKFVRARKLYEELKGPKSKLPLRQYDKAMAMLNISFMSYWFKQGNAEEAMEIYAALDRSEVMEPIVGNRLLEVLIEYGKKDEALDLFDEIIEICDSETVEIMMKGFSEQCSPVDRFRKTCYKTMIASLCEHGEVSKAEKFFGEMCSDVEGDDLLVGPDVSTYRAMINGYVKVGRVDDAIKTLKNMRISNLKKLAIHRAP